MGEQLGFAARSWLTVILAIWISAGPLLAQDSDAPPDDPAGAEEEVAGLELAALWILDFEMKKVGIIQPTSGVHRGKVYWYMIYRIENRTGQDRDAFISVTAGSDKKKVYANVFLPDVEALVERKVGMPLWGKVDEVKVLREKAKAGEIEAEDGYFNYFNFKADEGRNCVAIFNKLDPEATQILVTVEGLSNDLHVIENEDGDQHIQSRIFVLELERLGDEYGMSLDNIRLKKKGWSKKLTKLELPKEG